MSETHETSTDEVQSAEEDNRIIITAPENQFFASAAEHFGLWQNYKNWVNDKRTQIDEHLSNITTPLVIGNTELNEGTHVRSSEFTTKAVTNLLRNQGLWPSYPDGWPHKEAAVLTNKILFDEAIDGVRIMIESGLLVVPDDYMKTPCRRTLDEAIERIRVRYFGTKTEKGDAYSNDLLEGIRRSTPEEFLGAATEDALDCPV